MIKKNQSRKNIIIGLFIVEAILLFSLISIFLSPVFAEIGNNATVQTSLDVGNVYPEILNVSIDDDAGSVTLVANDTQKVYCIAVLRDFNGQEDLANATAEFFDTGTSFYGDTDDNNYHYTNNSCSITNDFGSYNSYTDDEYSALANCSFDVWYYANSDTWNCSVYVNDSIGWDDQEYDTIFMSELLSIGLPDFINYGEVNATEVSEEQIANVTNYGNVELNLSLQGYAISEGDDLAMNCTLGSIGTIPIEYEKYNLSTSTPGVLNLGEADSFYENLSSSEIVKEFNLNYRKNDTENEAINSTYWRIYVPIGVAGTCEGNIIFGARTEAGN